MPTKVPNSDPTKSPDVLITQAEAEAEAEAEGYLPTVEGNHSHAQAEAEAEAEGTNSTAPLGYENVMGISSSLCDRTDCENLDFDGLLMAGCICHTCLPSPCGGHKCVHLPPWGFDCVCPPGLSGPLCTVKSDAPAAGFSGVYGVDVSIPCSNGQCNDTSSGYVCGDTFPPTPNPTNPPTAPPGKAAMVYVKQQLLLSNIPQATFVANKVKMEQAAGDAVYESLDMKASVSRDDVTATAMWSQRSQRKLSENPTTRGRKLVDSSVVIDVTTALPAADEAVISLVIEALKEGARDGSTKSAEFKTKLGQSLIARGVSDEIRTAAAKITITAPLRTNSSPVIGEAGQDTGKAAQDASETKSRVDPPCDNTCVIGVAVGATIVGLGLLATLYFVMCTKPPRSGTCAGNAKTGPVPSNYTPPVKYGETSSKLATGGAWKK